MYRLKMLCYEQGKAVPYEDEPVCNPVRPLLQAQAAAMKAAQEEVDCLNALVAGETDITYMVRISKKKDRFFVLQVTQDGTETTVTEYFLEEVHTPQQIEIFMLSITKAEKARLNPVTELESS